MQSKGIYFNDGKNKGKMQVRISVFRFGNKKKRDYKRDTLVMLGLMCGVVFGQFVQQSQLSMEETRTVMAEDTKMIKKVAITFDDDVIIGLSQEISYERSGFDDLVLFSLF